MAGSRSSVHAHMLSLHTQLTCSVVGYQKQACRHAVPSACPRTAAQRQHVLPQVRGESWSQAAAGEGGRPPSGWLTMLMPYLLLAVLFRPVPSTPAPGRVPRSTALHLHILPQM